MMLSTDKGHNWVISLENVAMRMMPDADKGKCYSIGNCGNVNDVDC